VADILAEVLEGVRAPKPVPGAARSWGGGTVLALAKVAYEDIEETGRLENARLLVLSDALEGAGVPDAGLLRHLRSPGPHFRGCWGLDVALDKS
jgi:hypothetical protein